MDKFLLNSSTDFKPLTRIHLFKSHSLLFLDLSARLLVVLCCHGDSLDVIVRALQEHVGACVEMFSFCCDPRDTGGDVMIETGEGVESMWFY